MYIYSVRFAFICIFAHTKKMNKNKNFSEWRSARLAPALQFWKPQARGPANARRRETNRKDTVSANDAQNINHISLTLTNISAWPGGILSYEYVQYK